MTGTLNHDLITLSHHHRQVILDYLNDQTFLTLVPEKKKSTSKLPVLIYYHVSILSMEHVFALNLCLAVLNMVGFNGFMSCGLLHMKRKKKPFRRVFHLAQSNGFGDWIDDPPKAEFKKKSKEKAVSGWIIYGQTRNISEKFLRYFTFLLHIGWFDLGGSKAFQDHLAHVVFQDVWRNWNIIANRIEG